MYSRHSTVKSYVTYNLMEVTLLPNGNTRDILKSLHGKRVLVIGDLILDHYLSGDVLRISPEAPVPIVSLDSDGVRWVAGGAANVARNILSLGGLPFLAGLIGDDENGSILLSILQDNGINTDCVVTDPGRQTTTKTRIMARSHQLIRVDSETSLPVGGSISETLIRNVEGKLPEVDAVVFEDYDKGAIVPMLITSVLSHSRNSNIPVAVDPKFRNFFSYGGCSLFKPNRKEVSRALGIEIESIERAAEAGERLCSEVPADSVLLTMGESGSVLCRTGQPSFHLPAAARHVFDVSGAGDTVIAVMALTMGAGIPLEDGARFANFAAAAVCAEPGVYAVTQDDILREIGRYSLADGKSADGC